DLETRPAPFTTCAKKSLLPDPGRKKPLRSVLVRTAPTRLLIHPAVLGQNSSGDSRTMANGSVTRWIGRLQANDSTALQHLWERCFSRVVGLARAKLRGAPRRAADEEDVVVSAFDSFWRGAREGRFPRLDDRDNLWRLLATLTSRKAFEQVRDERAQ